MATMTDLTVGVRGAVDAKRQPVFDLLDAPGGWWSDDRSYWALTLGDFELS